MPGPYAWRVPPASPRPESGQPASRPQTLRLTGVVLGSVLLVASLSPSLVPRPALLQGVGSGLVFGIGYALGAAVSVLVALVVRPPAPVRLRRILRIAVWPVLGFVLVGAAVEGVAAQDEVRRMVEMEPLDGVDVTSFILGLVVTVAVCLGIGRLVRGGWRRRVQRLVARGRGRTRAGLVAVGRSALAVVVVVALVGGVAYVGLDRVFEARNGRPDEGLSAPDGTYRSGGTGSAVVLDDLGRNGADFVTGGPTAAEISAVTGTDAVTPVRVYVGVASAPTLEERAAIAVRELERTGAFDRKVLAVATTTGAGWVEAQAVDSLEYLHGGDTATVTIQYAHTPSFVSALTAPDLPVQATRVLFAAVRARWEQLPADHRPQLVVFGLSLGAQGVMNAFGSVDALRTQTEGAVLAGPTNSTPLWRELQASRDPGSPPWQPVLDGGRQVRWASSSGDLDALVGTWEAPRVAILQHATDGVTWLSPSLLWSSPDWLEPGNRAPDVSPHMRWIPIVTAVQVFIDMLAGLDVPARHGHNFGDVWLDGWIGVTGDGGLTPAVLAHIEEIIGAYHPVSPALS